MSESDISNFLESPLTATFPVTLVHSQSTRVICFTVNSRRSFCNMLVMPGRICFNLIFSKSRKAFGHTDTSGMVGKLQLYEISPAVKSFTVFGVRTTQSYNRWIVPSHCCEANAAVPDVYASQRTVCRPSGILDCPWIQPLRRS